MTRTVLSCLILTLAVMALASGPAAADWLVMVDGTRIETSGPWSQRGKLVVFTDTSGNLVSLRSVDVDLEASRRATAAAEQVAVQPAASPKPAATRPSVMRLTDDDVGHVDDYDSTAPAEGEPAEAEQAAADEPPVPVSVLEVTAWERESTPGGDGILVRATVENPSGDAAVGISVDVTLYDDEGEMLATAPARLAAAGLMPGQRTDLVATFPGVFDFSAVDFDIDHRALRARAVDQTPSVEADSDFEEPLDDGSELNEIDESS